MDEVVRYPWDEWLSRRRFRLRQGREYVCQPHSMAQQVRNAAYARGARVSIAIEDGVIIVDVLEGS